jgi:ceramide glucosyltransferase
VTLLWQVLLGISLFGTASSTIFLLLVLVAAARYRRQSRAAQAVVAATSTASLPPVTILKPLHGIEERLEQNLESFFLQDYPSFEIIFGARDATDPGLKVAGEVSRRHPNVQSRMVISGPPAWPNAKVFSLDKMLTGCANSYLILSDSDVEVDRGFLRNVIPLLLDQKVGLITCPYRGAPAGDFGSMLEGLGMSVEMPSGAMVADMLEGMRFALGPAVATRRDVLDKVGGIASVADYYSDDFELGHKVWAAGYRVVFSHHIVSHVLTPRSFWRTLGDQLRWMKSTRYSRPAGHIGAGLTFATPYGVLGLVAAAMLGHPGLGLWVFVAGFLNRVIQALIVGRGVIGDHLALTLCWLYPLRDLFGFFLWAGSFTSRSFFWRGEIYNFTQGGRIVPQNRPISH